MEQILDHSQILPYLCDNFQSVENVPLSKK
jgi:hypothetical protein